MIRLIKRFIWALRDYDSFKAFYSNMGNRAMNQLKHDLTDEDWRVINSRFYYAWIHAKRERMKSK